MKNLENQLQKYDWFFCVILEIVFRKKKGLTQTELAELVGKDRQYLYKIEKAAVTPNVVTISALAIALEIPLKEFIDIDVK